MKTLHGFFAIDANADGEIKENVSYTPVGRSGSQMREPFPEEVSQAPYGSQFFYLPGRIPYGKKNGKIELIKHQGSPHQEQCLAVGVIPPPGYTRTLLPAYKRNSREFLPFFAYTMGTFKNGQFHFAAIPTEISHRWDPSQYNGIDLKNKIKLKIKKHPENRLLKHLSDCAIKYKCYNAQNIFYERWEGGIPISSKCNAQCVGCISKTRKNHPASPQDRITFLPTIKEIEDIAISHLECGQAILSFGQGCEGEPTIFSEQLKEAISRIRQKTSKGTVNLNTNASKPSAINSLIDAGLDSIRVSMNSANEKLYETYYKPVDYSFRDVNNSILIAKSKGIFVSVNLLVMPGVTDSEKEFEFMSRFLNKTRPDMLQLRNLNIDPDLYAEILNEDHGRTMGMANMISLFKKEFTGIKLGNFTPPLRD